jgi:ribosome biogenesis GTPase
MTESPQDRAEGIVERVDATISRVRVGEELLDCTVRRKLVKFAAGTKTVAVGDRVRLDRTERGEHVIAEVLPRRSKLSRPGFRGAAERIIVANVDELVVVTAAAQPEYRTGLIDRYLVIAERVGFPGVLCVNKTDLVDRDAIEQALGFYGGLGYKVLFVSALDGSGLDELRELLTGRTSVLCGHSGVGKSSLINRMIPGVDLTTRQVSDATGKGRHVTSAVTMLALPGGGYLVDTPGIREFGLWGVKRDELPKRFPEFVRLEGQCRFRSCAHLAEPGCAVKAALESGQVHQSRYRSYERLYNELPASEWEQR